VPKILSAVGSGAVGTSPGSLFIPHASLQKSKCASASQGSEPSGAYNSGTAEPGRTGRAPCRGRHRPALAVFLNARRLARRCSSLGIHLASPLCGRQRGQTERAPACDRWPSRSRWNLQHSGDRVRSLRGLSLRRRGNAGTGPGRDPLLRASGRWQTAPLLRMETEHASVYWTCPGVTETGQVHVAGFG
jgi:hypothetical protein